jgi:hypothetical protein
MWRSVAIGVMLVGVLAGCSVGGGSGAASGGSTPSTSTPAVGLSLVAQESPATEEGNGPWTTTRRISLACAPDLRQPAPRANLSGRSAAPWPINPAS